MICCYMKVLKLLKMILYFSSMPDTALCDDDLHHLYHTTLSDEYDEVPPDIIERLLVGNFTIPAIPSENRSFLSPRLISDRVIVSMIRRAVIPYETPEVLTEIRKYIYQMTKDIVCLLPRHDKSRPIKIKSDDVIRVLQPMGQDVYGYGCGIRYIFCAAIHTILTQINPDYELNEMAMRVVHDIAVDTLDKLLRSMTSHCRVITATDRLVHIASGPRDQGGDYSSSHTVTLVDNMYGDCVGSVFPNSYILDATAVDDSVRLCLR